MPRAFNERSRVSQRYDLNFDSSADISVVAEKPLALFRNPYRQDDFSITAELPWRSATSVLHGPQNKFSRVSRSTASEVVLHISSTIKYTGAGNFCGEVSSSKIPLDTQPIMIPARFDSIHHGPSWCLCDSIPSLLLAISGPRSLRGKNTSVQPGSQARCDSCEGLEMR